MILKILSYEDTDYYEECVKNELTIRAIFILQEQYYYINRRMLLRSLTNVS